MDQEKDVLHLIAGCRRMDEHSQMELYRQFYSYGMSVCLRYTSSRESALEVLNDGFLKVFLKIKQYKSTAPFKPWLRRILINASIDYYRKYEQKRKLADEPKDINLTAYNHALDHLEFEDLKSVLHLMSPSYRMVFNLYVMENYTHAEIAKELKISVGSSKSNLSKGRNQIRELLKKRLGIHLKT